MSRAHWQGRGDQAARSRILALAASIAADAAAIAPHVEPRTEVDSINDRLRARAFDELEAEIAKLPIDQQELFRRIQRLLSE